MCFQKNYEKKDRRQAGKENGGDTIYYIYIYMICGLRLSTITSYLSTIICCGGSASVERRGLRWRFRQRSCEG